MTTTERQNILDVLNGAVHSRTVWFNFINLVLISIEAYSQVYFIDPKLLAVIVTMGNAWLRFITDKALSKRAK